MSMISTIAPRLPRFDPLAASRAARAVDQAVKDAELSVESVAGGTGGGDGRRLRGIPVVGRGVGGTSPGTNPMTTALDNLSRRSA